MYWTGLGNWGHMAVYISQTISNFMKAQASLLMKTLVKYFYRFCLLLGLTLPSLTWASPKSPRSPLMQYAQGENRTDKSRAADIARAAHGGKVLKVEEVNTDGRTLYRVKLLLDGGRIKIVTVDGSSGRII